MLLKLALVVSLLFIAHASYSAYEFVSYSKRLKATDPSIPADVVLELLSGVVIYCVASVLSAKPLKNAIRHEWSSTQKPMTYRPGFVDILKLRRDYKLQSSTK